MKKLFSISAITGLLLAGAFNANAQFDTLRSFNGKDGENPEGSLVLVGNTLIGMTQTGGVSNDGNVFSIKTNGSADNSFYTFSGINGVLPLGSLTYSGGHTIYGMTEDGGINNRGCVFSMDTNGSNYKDLKNFSAPPSTNGANPEGSLILEGKTLFGMTSGGGLSSVGNIFSIDTDGSNYKDLYDFTNPSGIEPAGSLILNASGTKLFGMTESGGSNSKGTAFTIDTGGTNFKVLWNFGGASNNGASPVGALTLVGHQLYGMTVDGGINSDGNIFSIDTNGSNYKDRWNFDGGGDTNGSNPWGELLLSGRVFLGMTARGGVNTAGNIFRIDTDGTRYHDIWNFNPILNGGTPYGDVTLSGVVLYGMASVGGHYADGVVFADTLISVKTTDTNISCNGSNDGHATVYITGGLSPFTYSWTGGSTLDKATGLSVGTYTVTVTDNNGMAATASVSISQPAALVITMASHTDVLCNGSATGNAIANAATGGTPAYTYLWTPSGGTTLTATGLSAGVYTITVTDSHGCTATASANITQPTAIASIHDSTADNGSSNGSAGITASGGSSPYTYLWNPGGETTANISGLSAGTYTCTVNDNNGCTYSTSVTVKSTAGINNITTNSSQITVYPNPNNGQFTIQSSVVSGQLSVEVYNMLGERIKDIDLTGKTNQIDLSAQAEGIYLYRVVAENGALVGQGKLIIQK